MSTEEKEDPLIRARRFKMGGNVDIDALDLDDFLSEVAPENEETPEPERDEALGDVFDPFSAPTGNEPGAIQSDGTVRFAPEEDVVSNMAREGERKVNWSLMVAMIFIFSALSIVAGTAFSPLVSLLMLVSLAVIGFSLGEKWVPDKDLNLLGVTWVIISMKVLYGLALELNRWEMGSILPISVETLAILLLVLVALNIFVAYRYEHDAIAAQATLILLAIGSTAGSIGGEVGVAIMILLATILLHGLAIHRGSGNLAALGIAASNLWIGMHAITDGFTSGSLIIEPLDTPLILFLLLMVISGINASMAARFAREDNWFSKGFKTVGLGQPGLWGVSISLGMIGALMAVASSREDTGYALGMVTFLGGAFGGSYLVVRGVEKTRVSIPLLTGGVILAIMLILDVSLEPIIPFNSYETFSILATILTGYIMLRDQNRVTDRVLWVGAVSILILLVILIPAEAEVDGGDGGIALLVMLSILHLGTAILAVMRKAPSLAGITVLLPWSWILIEELVQEAIRTVLVANDQLDPGSMIDLSNTPLAAYLCVSAILMIVVNIRMGETGVNLASGFLGITEISASIRDSGALQLWSMGLWLPMLTIISMAQLGGFTSVTLLIVTSLVFLLHLGVEFQNKRIGSPIVMVSVMAVSASVLSWRHGMDEIWMLLILIASGSVMFRAEHDNEPVYTNGMAIMSLPMLVTIASKEPSVLLESLSSIPTFDVSMSAVICSGVALTFYLSKSKLMENLLKPTGSALWLLTISIGLSLQKEQYDATYLGIAIFIATSLWLVARGEIRAELKSISRRDSRLEIASLAQERETTLGTGNIGGYDTRLADLEAKRKKRRDLKKTDDLEELYTTDISHKPRIVMMFLILSLGSGIVYGFILGSSPIIILLLGIFATALVSIAKIRTRSLNLDLPALLGIELPIGTAIFGLIGILLVGHIHPSSSNSELLDLAVVTILILELSVLSIWNQDNLLDRIPIAIDWFVLPLTLTLIAGTIMVESLPAPMTIDPFNGDIIQWQLPWFLLEGLLIITLLIDIWIGSRRENIGRDTHQSSSGRGARVLAYAILSWGPAGILAVANAINQGRRNKQVEAVGIAVAVLPIPLISLSNQFPTILEFLPGICYIIGVIMMIVIASSIPLKNGHWTMMAVINAHLMMGIGILTLNISLLIPITLFSLSTTLWVVGIMQLRKILRVLGLIDLVIGTGLTLLVLGGTATLGPSALFLLLAVIGTELALVTWLGQRNQEAMLMD
ncbi:MAG TPA: hypothetical protein QF508_02955 [Candidatus Thalassarchaeaceae archaeon]|nr:hypothetical protein [Candidatus Thalassarchaeaceae archaeon]MDP7658449.1 hypothetical protein [Candidatus Thalassarchaeaceae archaeon]HJO42346.1 hypothetical protein [Candidatus Thalassarchaeaceae archaeon]